MLRDHLIGKLWSYFYSSLGVGRGRQVMVMGRKSKTATLLEIGIKSEPCPTAQSRPVGTHDSLNIPDYGKRQIKCVG